MGGYAGQHEQLKKPGRATVRESNGAVFMLRCAELGLSDKSLAEMSIGMVYDLLIERANDGQEYPVQATQEDINHFFGGG